MKISQPSTLPGTPLPVPLTLATVVPYESTFLVVGGDTGNGYSDKVYLYTASGQWEEMTNMRLAEAKDQVAAMLVPSSLFNWSQPFEKGFVSESLCDLLMITWNLQIQYWLFLDKSVLNGQFPDTQIARTIFISPIFVVIQMIYDFCASICNVFITWELITFQEALQK